MHATGSWSTGVVSEKSNRRKVILPATAAAPRTLLATCLPLPKGARVNVIFLDPLEHAGLAWLAAPMPKRGSVIGRPSKPQPRAERNSKKESGFSNFSLQEAHNPW